MYVFNLVRSKSARAYAYSRLRNESHAPKMTDSAHRILLGFDIATEVDILHVAPRETNQLC